MHFGALNYELWAICFAINYSCSCSIFQHEFRKRARVNTWKCSMEAVGGRKNVWQKRKKTNNSERKSLLSKYDFTLFDFDGTLDRASACCEWHSSLFSHRFGCLKSATDCWCVYTGNVDRRCFSTLPFCRIISTLCYNASVEKRLHFELAKLFN